MARDALTPAPITLAGITIPAPYFAAGDSANGHSAVNGWGDMFIWVKNAGGASINVTILTPATGAQGVAISDPVIAVGAGAEKMIGPFTPSIFNQAAGDGVYIDLSDDTSVTIGAFRLPRVT